MAAPTRSKTMLERRIYPFDLDAQIAAGAVLSSVQAFASIMAPPTGVYPLQATTLAQACTVGDSTIHLTDDPLAGALLILQPGTGLEETLKVISTTPHLTHFDATVAPIAWYDHSISSAVSFEPGRSTRMLITTTPTPSGSNVSVEVEHGCHGQTYRISVIGTCNDGQVVEDEVTLVVTDPTPDVTNIKQATETRDLAAEMDRLMEEAHQSGATISSATAFASLTTPLIPIPTLAAQASAGVSSISMSASPGIGAMLTLTPAGTGANPPERVYVSNVSGGGPYTVTITPPLEFTHTNGVAVTTNIGVSTNFLVSTTSTVVGNTVYNRSRRGAVGTIIKMLWLATTSTAERLQHSGLVQISEI